MVTAPGARTRDVTGPAVNLVPAQYRNVSVADVPVALDEAAVRGYLLGRAVYRRTRYLVVRNAGARAVVEVAKESELPLFSPVTAVTMIARPEETAFVEAPGTDTAIPTQLARAAAAHAPGARCVVVSGRYGHVSFIADPAPIAVRVVEVVPPWPPKLVDQLERVLDLAEDLPPVELVADLVDLAALARTRPATISSRAARGQRARPAQQGRRARPAPQGRRARPAQQGRRARPGPQERRARPGPQGRRARPVRRATSPIWMRFRSGHPGRWWGAPVPGPSTTGSTAETCQRSTCARATSRAGPTRPGPPWPRPAR